MRQNLGRIGRRDTRGLQLFARQIQPAERGVFVQVAQNIGELEGPAQMMGECDAGIVFHAEHAYRKPPDRTGDAVAIEIERWLIRRANVGNNVHLHAVDDGDEIFAFQAEAAHRFGKPGKSRRCARRDRPRRCPRATVPTARAVPRAGQDRRRCRPPCGRTNRFRTSPRAARAAGFASRCKTSCGRPSGPPDWGSSLTHPAALVSWPTAAGRSAGPRHRQCRAASGQRRRAWRDARDRSTGRALPASA